MSPRTNESEQPASAATRATVGESRSQKTTIRGMQPIEMQGSGSAPRKLPSSAEPASLYVNVTTASYPDPSTKRGSSSSSTQQAKRHQSMSATDACNALAQNDLRAMTTLAGLAQSGRAPPPASLLPTAYSLASRATLQSQGQPMVLVKPVMTPGAETLAQRRSHSSPSLAAVLGSSSLKKKYQKIPSVGGKKVMPLPRSMSMPLGQIDLSPQPFLDKLLQARGYSTSKFRSLDGGYYCKPTPLQKASYGIELVRAVRESNPDLFKRLLSFGLSPNPCNAFGESIVHMVCRRGDFKLLQILVEAGCSLQVTDDFGRTPLHDACWTTEPNFDIVELILSTDKQLLHIVDCRGSSPLSYIKRDHWDAWIAFFQRKVSTFWPPRDLKKVGEEPPPPLTTQSPHSRPIQDPKNALKLDVAKLVASGQLSPEKSCEKELELKLKANASGQSSRSGGITLPADITHPGTKPIRAGAKS